MDTERRIKALEAELEQTEVAQKERDLAVRYHKIKFFGGSAVFAALYIRSSVSLHLFAERQKVTRKLNQTKKAKELAKESEKKKLEEELLRYRVDLNYILVRARPWIFSSGKPNLKELAALSQGQEIHLTIPT